MAMRDFSYQTGFTDDGMIWFHATAQGPDGTPLKMTLQVSRKEATRIADDLHRAVQESERKIISV